MCEVLNIGKKNYYKYKNKIDKDYNDYILIKKIFDNSKGTYGYRRIEEGLKREYGLIMNHKKIQRIKTKYNIMPEYVKKIRPNRYKRIEENVKSDLVQRKFNIEEKNKVWSTDITYLIFGNKRCYLSTIIDLYDRKVISYNISKYMNISLVIDTLNEAISKRQDVKGLILHSDQGFQYTSNQYKKVCESNGINISMSRKGTPIDDSPMESFHSLLKKETLYNNKIKSLDHYINLVKDWITFYNTSRISL